MKYWWKTVVSDYLTFSRRDKTAIIILMLLGVVLLVLPGFFSRPKQAIDKQAFVQELAQLQISIDSGNRYNNYAKDDDNFVHYQPKRIEYGNTAKGELFAFDPNTLDANGWKRLGIKDKTVQTIQKFREKGFVFRKPEDLKKIYGLRPEQVEQLMPFVTIEVAKKEEIADVEVRPAYTNSYVSKKSSTRIIDINVADTTELTTLYGIGSKLAARIINFRNKLGGFTSVAQLGETYGLADSTFQKIKPQLQCNQPKLQTININTADANQLKAHPYIGWNIANAIVRYREQHGNYKTLNDVLKIEIISQEIFTKISPYLAI